MRQLFDENLSHRLVELLKDSFPQAEHDRNLNLKGAVDSTIWDSARNDGLAIVSKDDDFRERAIIDGPPPKVVILRIGNCTTERLANLLTEHKHGIAAFLADPHSALLELP